MRTCLLLSLFSLMGVLTAQAQQISGTVSDQATGQALRGVTIYVPETKKGAVTDTSGRYQLATLLSGSYLIEVRFLGYKTQTRRIRFSADSPTVANFLLSSDVSQLSEVVVTGVTRNSEIRKSPVSIAVISKKEMDLNVNNNIVDAVLKGVPGLSAVTTGPNISKPFIRGLGYNRVLTLYNGVRQEGQQWGDEHGVEIDQYGIERAEVVKGPASLIYGSDAIAGVINFIPTTPKFTNGNIKGDFQTEYHTNNGMTGTTLGLLQNTNKLKWTLRGSVKKATAYQNRYDGRVYGTAFNELNFSGMLGVDKTWGSSYVYATAYENLQEIPDGSRDSLSRKFTRQVQESGDDDIKNRPVVPDAELRSYSINPLHQHIQHYRVYSRNRLVIGKGELMGIIGLQQSVRREYNHPTQPEQAGLFLVLKTLNYDLKYNFPEWKDVEATLGVNGMYQTNQHRDGTDFPIPNYRLFDIGSYVFLKKPLGRAEVSGGIRYDTRAWNWGDFYVRTNPKNGFDQPTFAPDTAGAALQFPSYRKNFTGVSGSIGLTYNLSERVLLKTNLARGYRAPNITEIGSNGLDPGARIVYLGNRNFKPEFSLQADVAFLANLPAWDISVELFTNTIQNYIYQARLFDANNQPVVIVPGNFTYQYQQSKAHLYGTELSVNYHPPGLSWLAVNNSLSFVRGLNLNNKLIDLNGDAARYLPFIPPLHTRSELRATVSRQVGPFVNAYARAEVDAYGNQSKFYGVDQTETFTAGYALLNIGFGSGISNGTGREVVRLFFQMDNVFDKAYQSHLNRLKYFEYYTASPTGRSGIFNMGRNFSAKIIVPF